MNTLTFSSPAGVASFIQTLAAYLGAEINKDALLAAVFPAELAHPGVKSAVEAIIAAATTIFVDDWFRNIAVSVLKTIDSHLS